MDNCMWSSFPYLSRCWSLPIQAKPLFRCFQCNPGSTCSSSCLAPHVSCSRPLLTTRCLCFGHGPHFPDPGKNFEGLLDIAEVPVLARREEDGYYYLGTVIKKTEGEKRTFLVQFDKSLAGEDEDTTVQKTSGSDILEYVNGMRHSILPGDKVLAPWELERRRYGPGTVIRGIETRDPLRVKEEEEEITVSFWNGKKAKVPLGVALWITPAQWQRIVDMIHMPLTSRKTFEGQLHRPNYHVCPCGPLAAPIYTCTPGGLHRSHCSFACTGPRVFNHMCSFLAHPQYSCYCCHLKPNDWWQQFSLVKLPQGGIKDEENSKANTQFLALEGPLRESAAAMHSSPLCSSESPNSAETSLNKNAMVDHAVNTDASLFDRPKQQAIKRPDWKYWKRSHPNSSYAHQGTKFLSGSCRIKRTDPKADSSSAKPPAILSNTSAKFEPIEQSPPRQPTVKEVLFLEDVKLSS